jgi:nitroimidazol reductase NimA-like FMN-containing flavoprotein (pyridoxamine 5'-phosphate oxidase superfamily)
VNRIPRKARYDAATIHAILDAGHLCHVGFADEGQPVVIPTLYGRSGDEVFFHGSAASRMLRSVRDGATVCLKVTLVDGMVLARSLFHSSMNYRSVVLFGRARELQEPGERLRGLRTITEHLVPGRWDEARQPSEKELQATSVLALRVDEASAKVSEGPPGDDEEDYALPIWAGVLPLAERALDPLPDPRLGRDIPLPPSALAFLRRRGKA